MMLTELLIRRLCVDSSKDACNLSSASRCASWEISITLASLGLASSRSSAIRQARYRMWRGGGILAWCSSSNAASAFHGVRFSLQGANSGASQSGVVAVIQVNDYLSGRVCTLQ